MRPQNSDESSELASDDSQPVVVDNARAAVQTSTLAATGAAAWEQGTPGNSSTAATGAVAWNANNSASSAAPSNNNGADVPMQGYYVTAQAPPDLSTGPQAAWGDSGAVDYNHRGPAHVQRTRKKRPWYKSGWMFAALICGCAVALFAAYHFALNKVSARERRTTQSVASAWMRI